MVALSSSSVSRDGEIAGGDFGFDAIRKLGVDQEVPVFCSLCHQQQHQQQQRRRRNTPTKGGQSEEKRRGADQRVASQYRAWS